MTEQTNIAENKALIERFFNELDDHNLDIVDELISDNFTSGIYRSGTEEEVSGKDGLKELMQEYWTAFPDYHGASMELIAEGDRVAIFREEHGTHEGEFRAIEPTGNSITFQYSGYFVIENGQIVHGYLHGDMINLLKQLGVEVPIPQ